MTSNARGFSLIEILVVVLIISILAGVVGVSVYRHPAAAKKTAARMMIQNFESALKIYKLEQGQFPTQEQGLEALCVKPTTPPVPQAYPPEGYLESRKLPPDPWGRPYVYIAPGRNQTPYEVLCYGADGEPGGEDDNADFTSDDL